VLKIYKKWAEKHEKSTFFKDFWPKISKFIPALIDQHCLLVTFISLRRMLEAKIKVEIFEHGDIGSPMKRRKENEEFDQDIENNSDEKSPERQEERVFRSCLTKIAEDNWDLQKLGMLKPYELTRFVLKIDFEGQFAGQLLGKLCWHWLEQPIPVGSRFFDEQSRSNAMLKQRHNPEKELLSQTAGGASSSSSAGQHGKSGNNKGKGKKGSKNSNASPSEETNPHILFNAKTVLARPRSHKKLLEDKENRNALNATNINGKKRPQTAGNMNSKKAPAFIPADGIKQMTKFSPTGSATLTIEPTSTRIPLNSKNISNSNGNFASTSNNPSIAQRHKIATFTRNAQREKHNKQVRETQKQEATREAVSVLLSGMAQLRADIENLDTKKSTGSTSGGKKILSGLSSANDENSTPFSAEDLGGRI